MYKKITPREIEELAYDLIRMFIEVGMWNDMCIYFLGCAVYTQGYGHREDGCIELTDHTGKVHIVYMVNGVSPKDYFQFAGDVLSVACEHSLEDLVLYNKTFTEFEAKITREYGLYFDLGNKWNMSLYHI